VKQPVDLVHLEGAPRVVRELHELRTDTGAAHQPVRVVDVVDRLDVHPIVVREGEPPDVIPSEQGTRVPVAELGELWSDGGRLHGLSGASGGNSTGAQSALDARDNRSGVLTSRPGTLPSRAEGKVPTRIRTALLIPSPGPFVARRQPLV
jgi:hypothetical protein